MKISSVLMFLTLGVSLLPAKTLVDANPYNPSNWSITSSLTGNGTQKYIAWDAQTYSLVKTVVNVLFPMAEVGVDHNVPVTGTDEASCSGQFQCTVTWIGTGPAPEKVLVKLGATIRQRGEGETQLGLPVLEVFDDGRGGVEINGELYKLISLESGTGQVTINGSAQTTLTWPASTWSGSSVEWEGSAIFTPRALGISADSAPTYSRIVGLNGTAYQKLDDTTDLSEREMTLGYTLEEIGDDLDGAVSFIAGANPVGDWATPSFGQWLGGSLSTFESSNGETALVGGTTSQSQLLDLSAADTWAMGNVTLFYQETNPRSNGQTLPGMNSKLIVKMHAPAGFVSRAQRLNPDLHTVALHGADGKPIYATVMNGQSRTRTVGFGHTETHMPMTLTFAGGLDVKRSDFITLKVAPSLAVPLDVQNAYQTVENDSYTVSGTTAFPTTYQLVAREVWQESVEYYAMYGAHGFEGDKNAVYAIKGTYGLSGYWKELETGN